MRKRKKIHSILVVAGIACLAGAVFRVVDTGRTKGKLCAGSEKGTRIFC